MSEEPEPAATRAGRRRRLASQAAPAIRPARLATYGPISSSPSVIQLGPSIGPECVWVYESRTCANGMPQSSATA